MISHFDFRRKMIILCSVSRAFSGSLVNVCVLEMWSSLGLDLVIDPREKWAILGYLMF